MGLAELLLVAVGLSMDAFAVSVCKGLALKKTGLKDMLWVGLWFGLFQGLMPLIGFMMGAKFVDVIDSVDHWVAFVLLGLIGSNMVREGLSGKEEEEAEKGGTDVRTMFMMAVATSIDALAVGVTFAFVPVKIFGLASLMWATVLACAIICSVTFVISAAGVKLGSAFGGKYRKGAEITGGVILIIIGLKILLEGLGVI